MNTYTEQNHPERPQAVPLDRILSPSNPEDSAALVLAALRGKRSIDGIAHELSVLRWQVSQLRDADGDVIRSVLSRQAALAEAAANRYMIDAETCRNTAGRQALMRVALAAQRTLALLLATLTSLPVVVVQENNFEAVEE